jgi:integrase
MLEFCILTATRASEALGCRWQEIDGDAWAIPASRMKAGKPHNVPLSPAACGVIEAMRAIRVDGCDFVFPGRFKYRPMSSKAFERLLETLKAPVTTHGFRSSFRDWSGNETATPRDVCEMALAHKVGDATEQAYRRGDAPEKRRVLMAQWCAYVDAPPPADNVVAFRRG